VIVLLDCLQEAHCSDHSDGGRDSPAVSGTVDEEKKSKQLPRKEVGPVRLL